MTRAQAIPYVGHVIDEAGCGRKIGDDIHAVVREVCGRFKHASILIGWQCGFEPMFVAVHSYLDVHLTDEEAEDMAAEYLNEIGWRLPEDAGVADYVIR